MGGTLIDGTGKEPIENCVVVVEGSEIVDVGRAGEVDIPSDTRVLDATGRTVMPGLVDTHVHIGHKGLAPTDPPSFWALSAARNARDTLESGVTTVMNLSSMGATDDMALKKAIEKRFVPGSRMYVAGRIQMTSARPVFRKGVLIPADGVDEIRERIREYVASGVDLIKVFTSLGMLTTGGYARNYTLEEIETAVDESHALGRKVAAHAVTPVGIKNAIEAGVDSIEHGYGLDDEDCTNMVKKGIFWVPTTSVIVRMMASDPTEFEPAIIENAKNCV